MANSQSNPIEVFAPGIKDGKSLIGYPASCRAWKNCASWRPSIRLSDLLKPNQTKKIEKGSLVVMPQNFTAHRP